MDIDDEIAELDLSHISHGCAARMKDLAEIQWRDFINQDPLNHLVLLLSCDVFVQYISSRTIYFYLKYYELFFYSKSRRSPTTAIKTLHITAPWRHSKYPLLWYNGLVMLSRLLGDITMGRWHCHWYQTIIWPGKPGSCTQDRGSRKTWIFYLKTWI